MITGAFEEAGVKRIPTQPARPIAVKTENAMTRKVENDPQKDLRTIHMTPTTIRYMTGTSVFMSP